MKKVRNSNLNELSYSKRRQLAFVCTNGTGLLQDDPEQKAHVKGYESDPPPPRELRGLVERLLVHLKDKEQPN